MESLMKADIFFFVSTIVLVVFGILGTIILFYVIRIVKNFSETSEKAKHEVNAFVSDVSEMRQNVRHGLTSATAGIGMKGLMAFIMSMMKNRSNGRRSFYDEYDDEEEEVPIRRVRKRRVRRKRPQYE